jgi:ABC-type glutathione transport system ATPase component
MTRPDAVTRAKTEKRAAIADCLAVEELCVDLESHGETLRIVDRLSLTIARGETLGLVGESGSGKSTVANAILRLLPTRSHARISGSNRLVAT